MYHFYTLIQTHKQHAHTHAHTQMYTMHTREHHAHTCTLTHTNTNIDTDAHTHRRTPCTHAYTTHTHAHSHTHRSGLLQGADSPEDLQARIEELSGYLVCAWLFVFPRVCFCEGLCVFVGRVRKGVSACMLECVYMSMRPLRFSCAVLFCFVCVRALCPVYMCSLWFPIVHKYVMAPLACMY